MSQNKVQSESCIIDVVLSAESFRAFAFFDIFIRLRRWVPMAIFAGIMTGFAAICFLMREKAEQATMLGIVLLVIGLGLPGVYGKQFFSSVKAQITKLGLTKPKPVYKLTVAPVPGTLMVEPAQGENETFSLAKLYGVYQTKHAIYLYAESTKAYIVPNDCVENPQKLWQFLCVQLPSEKMHPRKKGS